jgi:type IV pilus assembly protein PilQ
MLKLRENMMFCKKISLLMCASVISGSVLFAPGVIAEEDQDAPKIVEELEARINLSYRRAPLERVLDRIAGSAGGINIKIHDEDDERLAEYEKMPVSIDLSGVTWRTAIDYVAKKYRFVVNTSMEQDGVILLERPPRITMNVQKAPIENVIKLIASDANANIIIGPEVKGIVTFSINDVPWKEALDSILKTHGFIKVEDASGVIRVTTPEKVQQQQEVRIFSLRYVSPEGSRYRAKLSSDYVERAEGAGATGNEFSLLQVLEQIKSPEGTISYERRTNQLIIKDTATKLAEIERIIKEIDQAPLQIQLTTRIMTYTSEGDDDRGVKWDQGLTSTVNGGSWATTFPFSVKSEADNFGAFGQMGPWSAITYPKAKTGLSSINYETARYTNRLLGSGLELEEISNTYGTMSFSALQATLQLYKYDQNVKLLQAPQIVALDNEEATIHIGKIIRYAEFYSETTDSGGTQTGYRAATPLQLGVQLLVVPHVIRSANKILLTVIPKTEDLDGEGRVFGEGTDNELWLPQTISKTVVTRMMLNNKETGVIAGLISDKVTTAETKVPVIGDIPVIGKLFSSKSVDPEKTNVNFLITPQIIKPNDRQEFDSALASIRKAAQLGE